jgi:hypothetical protein
MHQIFPSYETLNRELQDSRIDATVYNMAKELYETCSPPPGVPLGSDYHMRTCLQQAICRCRQKENRKEEYENRSSC